MQPAVVTKYRADIDGLRAIAVGAVICFHAGFGFSGGYVGVDVFLVISGFLITQMLVPQLQANDFRWLEFWERRLRRIFPALAVMLLACWVAGYFFLLPQDYREFGQSLLAQLGLCANGFFWVTSEYFSQPADLKPLLHTWSLALEEQFYLLYPFLLWAARRHLRVGLGLTLCLSLTCGIWMLTWQPSAAFYLLPCRAWELILGGCVALWSGPSQVRRGLGEAAGMAGLALLLGSIFAYSRSTPFPGLAALVPCVGTALLLGSGPSTWSGRVLSLSPLVGIGLISYSWYLWHWPALAFLRYWSPGEAAWRWRLGAVLGSGLVAVISYQWVETPLRRYRLLASRQALWASSVAVALLLASLSLQVVMNAGWPGRLPAALTRLAEAANDPPIWSLQTETAALLEGKLKRLGPAGAPRLLIWGDSHVTALWPVLVSLARQQRVPCAAAFHSGTVPLLGFESTDEFSVKKDSLVYSQAVVDYALRQRVGRVLLIARWAHYPRESQRESLQRTVQALRTAKIEVWVMRSLPEQSGGVPRLLAMAAMRGENPDSLGVRLRDYQARNAEVFSMFQEFGESLVLLDPAPTFFLGGREHCRLVADGDSLFFDDNHVSRRGALLLEPRLRPAFQNLP